MLETYAEYGAVGVVIILFGYMVLNLMSSQKMQNEDLAAITDQMQNQFGVDKAGSFNANVNGIIDNLFNASDEIV